MPRDMESRRQQDTVWKWLCETQETVYIHTGLLGPEKGEEKKEIATYPYVVVELEETEKNIRFE